MPKLIIFDFDGVVADSESLACAIAADFATELGAPMSAQDGLDSFMGKRVADVAAQITQRGGRVPDDFAIQLQERTLRGFAEKLEPVDGVLSFLEAHRAIPRCIASSSSHARLAGSLQRIALTDWFDGCVFSVDDVSRGKPFPDIFLHAAKVMGCAPADALVIEDSIGGVQAAVAAGMPVIGLLAGMHLGEGHGVRLHEAGATAVVGSYAEIADWIAANTIR
jgi:HAD superfamily hydrolase (TIGR01509 family)